MISLASVPVAAAAIVAFARALETAVMVVPAGMKPIESVIVRPTSPWVNAPDEAVTVSFADVDPVLTTPAVTVGFKIHFCNPPSPTLPPVVQTVSGPLELFFG